MGGLVLKDNFQEVNISRFKGELKQVNIGINYHYDIKCTNCGHTLYPSVSIISEYNALGDITGRKKYIVDKLFCPNCYQEELVDNSFDGDWFKPRIGFDLGD